MKYYLLCILLSSWFSLSAQAPNKLQTFPLQDVQLLPGIFKDAQLTDLNYMMALEPDRLLSPYLREAGLQPKALSYTNWENTGLDGHIGGHYLSALAMMYASTGDKEVLHRLNYMIAELKKCQDKNGNGYVGGVPGSTALWTAVMQGDVAAIKKKWVPLYNIHKTFAGIRDAYLYTGNQTAKVMLIKFADWFVKLSTSLSPQKMQEMLQTEHGGINEVLADVYALTGDKKYLTAAYSFSHQAILQPLENNQDKLNNLHANTQIPKVIGFERIAALNADTAYNHAAQFFWETVVNHRTVAIGGNSVREHFNPANDFSSMMTSEQGPETCNTYNMLKLTEELYLSDPKVSYIDYYERALYNHILSTERPEGGFVYFTPMRAGHYRVYSQPQTSMWCCVGSGMENHAKYGKMIYTHNQDNLFVNLFIPSKLTWQQKGLKLTQQTRFPESSRTTLTINTAPKEELAINIRYPSWVKAGNMQVWINNKKVEVTAQSSGYVSLKGVWKKNDVILANLPTQTSTELLPDGSHYETVLYGPIVLAAVLDTTNMTGLSADDSRMGHVARGTQYPLQTMPMFVNQTNKPDAQLIHGMLGPPLTFTAPQLIYPAKYSQLKLIPFYKIHDARYVIYWDKESPEGIAALQNNLAAQDAFTARLAALTIDMVNPGEQQPESDHFMESENSNAGVYLNRHWRDARGWFSYKLTDKDKQAATLSITYYGKDAGRNFSILVNNQVITKVALDGSKGDKFYIESYPIPESIVQSSGGVLKVKFLASDSSVAGGIFEVRLLKK